jgi:molecular chaperone DnaK
VAECEFLGTVKVGGLPPRPKGEVRVAVEFALGAEGILSVTARNQVTGAVTAVTLATRDTPAEARAKLGVAEPATPPPGARPIEPSPQAGKPGLLSRLFRRKA